MTELTKLNNFNGMAALYSGIVRSHTSKKTMHSLPQALRQTYEYAEQLFSDKSSHKRYREALRNATLPCIPYVGLFLIEIENLLTLQLVDGGQIWFERCVEVANLVGEFTKYQIPYNQFDFKSRNFPLEKLQLIPCVQKWLRGLVDDGSESVSNEQQYTGILKSLVARFVVKVKEESQSPLWTKVRISIL
jgi:hypothetical protein